VLGGTGRYEGARGSLRLVQRSVTDAVLWQPSNDRQEIPDEALSWAARNDRAEAVEALVARGAALDAAAYRGTALS
jgi:hypothetical protein